MKKTETAALKLLSDAREKRREYEKYKKCSCKELEV